MKPTRLQTFFASGWLEKWIGVPLVLAAPVLTVYFVAAECLTFLDPLGAWWELGLFAGFMLLSVVLGFFLIAPVVIICICPFMIPLHHIIEKMNGGPFHVGDMVQILSGKHRGRVGQVYSDWQGDSVRVEIGAAEKEDYSDVFSPTQLLLEERGPREERPDSD